MNEKNLKNNIENLFKKGNSNLIGKFTNRNEFTAYDKWTVIGWAMPNLKRKSAYLKGKIVKSEKGISLSLDFKPNTILSVFAIISILMGITSTIIAKTNNQYLIVGLILIAVVF
ncbi:hypothetical protein [Wenyingzhuangia sp. 2_MG-2023]|uniref:hypothetical protein n=1 Tax=Wenyingzhuangia sp. 2_MG-2023 TaxID=3062639 RepID=UPI0026E13796|nr:hypothetical protein [Wenyingzhuangia sp. 2_MG-2023]MDO6739503.1 hypothetical protein [Wenyingzhuangia sp. 2_MG-2023]